MPQPWERRGEAEIVETDRATAHLPGLDVEIMHRRAPGGEAEEISIHLRAVPSFEAFGRALDSANPFMFWARAAELAWQPWLEAANALALPWTRALPRPSGGSALASAPRRDSSRNDHMS
jgi:hypothetical protein